MNAERPFSPSISSVVAPAILPRIISPSYSGSSAAVDTAAAGADSAPADARAAADAPAAADVAAVADAAPAAVRAAADSAPAAACAADAAAPINAPMEVLSGGIIPSLFERLSERSAGVAELLVSTTSR